MASSPRAGWPQCLTTWAASVSASQGWELWTLCTPQQWVTALHVSQIKIFIYSAIMNMLLYRWRKETAPWEDNLHQTAAGYPGESVPEDSLSWHLHEGRSGAQNKLARVTGPGENSSNNNAAIIWCSCYFRFGSKTDEPRSDSKQRRGSR